jgi:hypothetical protein
LAYAARDGDPTLTLIVADEFLAHKRIRYNNKTAVEIMDDDNRDIAFSILTLMLNTCRSIIIQVLPSVFKCMGQVGVILLDKMIKYLVPDYKMTPAKYSMDGNFPMYCMDNKVMGKTCLLVTCPHIGSTRLPWPSGRLPGFEIRLADLVQTPD